MSDARSAGIAVVSRMTYGQRQPTFQIFADVDKIENPDICKRVVGKGQSGANADSYYYGTTVLESNATYGHQAYAVQRRNDTLFAFT
jgi:hypothetical protein